MSGARWALLALVAAGAVLGLSWLSLTAVGLERERAESRARSALEEQVRLALWRMDGLMARRVAAESARSPHAWRSLWQPAELLGGTGAQVSLPSELLEGPPPGVLLHFELDGNGVARSPQVPEAQDAARLLSAGRMPRGAVQGAERLRALREQLDPGARDRLWRAGNQAAQPLVAYRAPSPREVPSQVSRSLAEFGKRQVQSMQNANAYELRDAAPQRPEVAPERHVENPAPFVPLWLDAGLFLVRRAVVDGDARLQAVWLDWTQLQGELLREVEDLLPGAALLPVRDSDTGGGGDLLARQLASIPARLAPGALPPEVTAEGSLPLWPVLGAAWTAVLLALVALAVLLAFATALAERRAAFVSAVTHELRTPLTTFRMYSEMMVEGMVSEPAQRQSYLETLQREADRLGRLVENVLAYARLEKRRPPRPAAPAQLGPLVDAHAGRLHARAGEAGRALQLRLTASAGALWVRVDGEALEQVLFNLVDNACKYGAGAIRVTAERRGHKVALLVRDEGQGVPRHLARRLFEPFSRAAEEAAGAAPGVGLGLALSRRLMRALGGDLRYEPSADGARFVVLMPSAPG